MDFEKELSEIYPWILKVARKFCCSMQDAEDLAGDTVYKLLVNRDKFDCSKPLQPWCLIIMRNTYIIRYNRNSLIHFTGLDMVDGMPFLTVQLIQYCLMIWFPQYNGVLKNPVVLIV